MASRLLAFWSHGDLVRHGPHTSYECTSQSDDDLVRMWAACDAAASTCAPPPLRLPAAVLEGLGRLCEAPWQMAPDFCGRALRPCTGDEAPRAWVWPAGVSAPCRRRSPLEEADGSRPQHGISCLGLAKRVRAPRAAPGVTAPVPGPPRKAWSASTTGYQRQAVPCSWRAGARRPRRSGCAGTARPSSGKTMGCAGVGQPPAESHRRCAGPQLAPPV
jgi:hypothetical protein